MHEASAAVASLESQLAVHAAQSQMESTQLKQALVKDHRQH